MFKPVSYSARIFSKYLSMFAHPSKIRIQNFIGKYFFKNGIRLQNEDAVIFTLDANDWITRIMLMKGNYENASTSLAKELLCDGGTFIDIGTNFGLYTCIVAQANANVKVIAIEPNYKIIPGLIENLQNNSLQQRVQVKQVAIGSKIEWVTLQQPAADNVGTTQTKAGGDGLLSILSCPLEFICSNAELEHVQLIKIDIEGNEFEVLSNFPFHRYQIQNIILEFNHLSPVSFKELQSFFEHKGFECFSVNRSALIGESPVIEENNIWLVNRNSVS